MERLTTGLLAHVNPVFMVPAVGISLYGAVLAPTVSPRIAVVHAVAVGVSLFVAHLRDGYVDGHLRDEERPVLSVSAFQWSVRLMSLVALVLGSVLAVSAGLLAALSVMVLLTLALLHAPYLDRNPVSVTLDYPLGIAVALVGGFLTQTGRIGETVIATAVLLFLLLAGIKIGIDCLDASFDQSIEKRTVPVLLGPAGADRVAATTFASTAILHLALVTAGFFSPASAVAVLAPFGCFAATVVAPPALAVRIQMGLTYGFMIVIFALVCGDDCAGIALLEEIAV